MIPDIAEFWNDPEPADNLFSLRIIRSAGVRVTDEGEKMAGFVLVDGDPDGVEIMLTYRHGSKVASNFI